MRKPSIWYAKLKRAGVGAYKLSLHDKDQLASYSLYTWEFLGDRPQYDRDVLHVSRYNCESFRFLKRGVFCTDGVTAGYHLPGHCPFAQTHVPRTYHIGSSR